MNTAEPNGILILLAVAGATYCTYEIWSGLKNERMNLILWAKSEAVKRESVGKFYMYLAFNVCVLASCLFYIFA